MSRLTDLRASIGVIWPVNRQAIAPKVMECHISNLSFPTCLMATNMNTLKSINIEIIVAYSCPFYINLVKYATYIKEAPLF